MKEEKKFVIYMVMAFVPAWILQFVGIINARTILFLKMSMWKETSMNY